MSGTKKQLNRKRGIKQEEDEEWPSCSTEKRRNTEQTLAVLEQSIKEEEEEEEEEWSDEDEPSEGDDSLSDPDYDHPDEGGFFSDYSGGEICKQRNANVNGDTVGDGLSWEFRSTPDTPPEQLRFKPTRPSGPSLATSSSWTPLSVFQLFCSTSVIRKIVDNTNKNGERQKEARGRAKWTQISFKDFYMFLITVLFTSLVKTHDLCDLWKTSWPYGFRFPGDSISKNSFEAIRTALFLCDPEGDEENESKKETPEYDKLFKIKPFYTELVNACKAHFHPHSNICVHERKARKNKPLKCGFRVFALADSLTGYTWNLHIDTGKTAATRGRTAGYTAVKNLLPVSVLGSGYTLYTDGLFSSPRLFSELLDNNIGCCGILSKHHSEFPKGAQNDFPAPQASRGDIRWLRKDKFLFVKWMDTREVAMCSTVHEAFTGQVIKRPVKESKGWVAKQFSCPDAVADFNRHMIVPGKSDMDFSFNMPCTKVRFWHRLMFYHLLDLVVVNSYILYKEVMKLRGELTYKGLMQRNFREMLGKEMYKFAKGCDPYARTPAQSCTVSCMPAYFVPGSATAGRKRCSFCKQRTPIFCEGCLVPLCLVSTKNCFKGWHDLDKSKA